VQVSNVNCPGIASDTISVLQQPENNYPPEIFSCVQAVQISPSIPALPGSSYSWNNGDTTATISVNTPGNYFVTVSNGNCIFTDTVQVDFGNNGLTTGLNVFTPNGDGINDVFGFPNALPEGYNVEVYNRWGNSLFQSNNPAQLWDGTFNGSATEEGVYYWRLRTFDCLGNPTEEAGFVSLMR
jgi:gliding motility-associated-like protein